MQLSDGSKFDVARRELIIYDSSKPYPHSTSRVYINDVQIDQIRQLPVEEILELLSYITEDPARARPQERWQNAIKERDYRRSIYNEMCMWYELSENKPFKQYVYEDHYNQYYILFKNKSCASQENRLLYEYDKGTHSRNRLRRGGARRRFRCRRRCRRYEPTRCRRAYLKR